MEKKYKIGDTVHWYDYKNYNVFKSPLVPPIKEGIVTSLTYDTLNGELVRYGVTLKDGTKGLLNDQHRKISYKKNFNS